MAIFAHGLGGGGTAPDGSALALLFAACTVIGVTVASVRPRSGLASVMGMLAAGQGIGHIALSMSPEHHHHAASPTMLVAHLIAIPFGALVIRAGETGMRRAITSARRFIVALGITPAPTEPPARISSVDERAAVQLLLVSPGIGRRGPPALRRTSAHLVPA